MTVANRPRIRFDDTPNLDAFGRQRVSSPTLLVDSKRIGSTPDLLMDGTVTGSGAITYAANEACTKLTVGAAAGTAVRQSKLRAIYQPAKSLLDYQTFVMPAAQANLRARVGYFDTKSGVFLQRNGSTVSLVLRSYTSGAPVDTAVDQASWNIDTLGGNGPSGITLDLTKAQILWVDLEYLGVGRVRAGFVINGQYVWVHEFNHANVITGVYMSNPNLPLRWEIEATAGITGTATMQAICGSIMSEGGYETIGVTHSADSGTTANNIAAGANEEILAVRIQSSFR